MRQKWIRYHKRQARFLRRALRRLQVTDKAIRFAYAYGGMGSVGRYLENVDPVLVKADFSELEARIIAWYANERAQGRPCTDNLPLSHELKGSDRTHSPGTEGER